MAKNKKLLEKALNGSDLTFKELETLALSLGFEKKAKKKGGSHFTKFVYPGHPVVIPVQEGKGKSAKKYQVEQLLKAARQVGAIDD